MNDQVLSELLERYGSFYLYDEGGIRSAAARLTAHFPGVQFLYSVKANPAGRVLDTLFSLGFGADAASLNEVLYAEKRNVPKELIGYSAPGKTEAELRGALGKCTVVADSFHELELLDRLCADRSAPVSVGLRLNPDFTFAGDGGIANKFGVDAEEFFARIPSLSQYPHLRISGIHVHAKSQELQADALKGYYARMFDLARRVETALGYPLDFVNFGSGIGICWSQKDTPVDVADLGAAFSLLLTDYRKAAPQTRIFIETGRYVTGPYGVYVTRVVDKKRSRGETFVLLQNTLNGFSRPCVARAVGNAAPCEPLYAGADTYTLRPLNPRTETETVTLAGNLCTAADTVVKGVVLPRLEIGEGLLFSNAGCYSAVMTPMQFASLTPPAQLFLTESGSVLES